MTTKTNEGVTETRAKSPRKDDGKIQVAGRVDRAVWSDCELRAFTEDRIKSNSAIIEAALIEYAKGANSGK